MKKLILTETQIQQYNLVTFSVFDCRVIMQKQPEPRLTDNMSRANWLVFLETEKDSNVYMQLLFDECYDIKNPRTKAFNKSKAGNPYIGFLYCPKSWPEDRNALEAWKKSSVWRYPRLQDCLRFMTGIFTDCGLTIEDFTDGIVKYDDLIDYVKAWEKSTVVGHPYHKNVQSANSLLNLGQNYSVKEEKKAQQFFGFSAFDDEDDETLPF